MIEFKNVSFSYEDTPVINNLSFTVESGKNLLITGASGCGKTTVMRLMLGLIRSDSGTVSAPSNITAVFQEDRLIEKLSAYKNIILPLDKRNIKKADELITELNLDGIKSKRPADLSGGMKRRVAILRAVSYGGDAIILDEPFNGIDDENIRLIVKMINREFTEKGKSVILISHNVKDAAYFSADILKLEKAEG